MGTFLAWPRDEGAIDLIRLKHCRQRTPIPINRLDIPFFLEDVKDHFTPTSPTISKISWRHTTFVLDVTYTPHKAIILQIKHNLKTRL
jgi:hypothetical protein